MQVIKGKANRSFHGITAKVHCVQTTQRIATSRISRWRDLDFAGSLVDSEFVT